MYLNIKIILSVSLIFLAATIKNFSNLLDDKLTSKVEVGNSKINFELFSSLNIEDNTDEEERALIIKKIPVTSQRFYKKHQTKKIKYKINWIHENYDPYI